MSALIGGVAALLIGFITLIAWWGDFIALLKGAIPVVFLLGGALAAYLGYEELKDKRQAELEAAREPFAPQPPDSPEVPTPEEADKYKQEVEELKAKLKKMEEAEATQEEKKA